MNIARRIHQRQSRISMLVLCTGLAALVSMSIAKRGDHRSKRCTQHERIPKQSNQIVRFFGARPSPGSSLRRLVGRTTRLPTSSSRSCRTISVRRSTSTSNRRETLLSVRTSPLPQLPDGLTWGIIGLGTDISNILTNTPSINFSLQKARILRRSSSEPAGLCRPALAARTQSGRK